MGPILVLFLLLGLLASCGGDDGGDEPEGAAPTESNGSEVAPDDPLAATGFVAARDDADPVEGGTLVFAPFASPATLDPARQTDSGVGNAELSAIYDALVRYDYEQGEYVPFMAESFEANDDFSEWTVHLREGIEFSDGTPLNAAAVIAHLERSQGLRPGTYIEGVTATAPDEMTVVYALEKPWAGFPYALAAMPGRIPSPTAVEAAGEDFGKQPVGAGPFVLESWTPGEEMVLKANPGYWGDGPYLEGLRFVSVRGDQAKLDALSSGQIDATFLRAADVVKAAVDGGMHGFNNVLSVGEALIINNGVNSADTPGADVRIRQALAYAIDTDALNDVVHNGSGIWSKRLYPKVSDVAGKTEAVSYDPERATELLEEAKADGFDGQVQLTCDAAPEREREGLALQAQLNAVGFDVELNRVPVVTDTIRMYLQEGSFEIACYGFSFQDVAPYVGPVQVLSPVNRLGYEDPQMEALLDDLRSASGDEVSAAIDAIQERVNETQPFIPLAATRELITWDPSVRGMDVTVFSQPIWNKAWLDR